MQQMATLIILEGSILLFWLSLLFCYIIYDMYIFGLPNVLKTVPKCIKFLKN